MLRIIRIIRLIRIVKLYKSAVMARDNLEKKKKARERYKAYQEVMDASSSSLDSSRSIIFKKDSIQDNGLEIQLSKLKKPEKRNTNINVNISKMQIFENLNGANLMKIKQNTGPTSFSKTACVQSFSSISIYCF